MQNYVNSNYPVLLNGNPFRSPIQLCHEDIFSICSRGFQYLAVDKVGGMVTRSKRSISPTIAQARKKRVKRNSPKRFSSIIVITCSPSLETSSASLPVVVQTPSLSLSYSEDEKGAKSLGLIH